MVTLMEYIKTIIEDFLEETTGTKSTPAADHLFTVRSPSLAKVLSEEQAMTFHCNSSAPVSEPEGMVIHSACHGFSDHMSAVAR